MVGGGSVGFVISLSEGVGGNEKHGFERDGISKDKPTANPSFIRVFLLVFSLLSVFIFL
jgi:hypothetical protein